ncbi:MAG: serine protease [Bdellovibrionota bacterium]|nr:serine protease [Bdellovibrionota bacterium]
MRICYIIALLLLISCGSKKEITSNGEMCTNAIIYGENDMTKVSDAASSMQEVSESVAGMIHSARFSVNFNNQNSDNQSYRVMITPIEQFIRDKKNMKMCNNQINRLGSAFSCTGFLVGKDLLMTAGHCLTPNNDFNSTKYRCQRYEWVFGLEKEENFYQGLTIKSENRFRCKEVLAFENSGPTDYALIKLDREVPGRKPLKMKSALSMEAEDILYTVGFPYGSPMKISRNGKFNEIIENSSLFKTKLDTFPSFSGAPVIDQRTHEVVGIHINGLSEPLEVVGNCLDFSKKCENEGDCGSSQAQRLDSISELSNYIDTGFQALNSSCN